MEAVPVTVGGVEMQSDWAQKWHLSPCFSLFRPVRSDRVQSSCLPGPQQRILNQPKRFLVSFSMYLFETHTKAGSVGHPCFLLGPGEKVWIHFFFLFLLMEQFWGIYFPIIIAAVELLGPGYWGIRLGFFKPSFSATRWVLRTLNFTSAPSDLCWDEQQKEYESFIHESTHLKDASVNLWWDIFFCVFFFSFRWWTSRMLFFFKDPLEILMECVVFISRTPTVWIPDK